MARMAFPRKVRIAATEIQVKKTFTNGLKSVTSCPFSFTLGEVVRGSGFPPGPVWEGTAWATSSSEAVMTAWAIVAARNKTRRTIGYE